MSFEVISLLAMEIGYVVLIGLIYLSIMMMLLYIAELARMVAEKVKNARNKDKDTRRDTKHE